MEWDVSGWAEWSSLSWKLPMLPASLPFVYTHKHSYQETMALTIRTCAGNPNAPSVQAESALRCPELIFGQQPLLAPTNNRGKISHCLGGRAGGGRQAHPPARGSSSAQALLAAIQELLRLSWRNRRPQRRTRAASAWRLLERRKSVCFCRDCRDGVGTV